MKLRSPLINRVPFEIWGAILKLSCSREEPQATIRCWTILAPVTVSHVCTTWRDIVNSTPQLWTEISLLVNGTLGIPNVNLMSLFLVRSRNQPLSVNLTLYQQRVEPESETHRFLVELFSNAARWKTAVFYFSLEFIKSASWRDFHSIIKGTPLLQSLKLHIPPTSGGGTELALPSRMWMDSPALTKLVISVDGKYHWGQIFDLRDMAFPGWPIRNRIPYNKVTHLMLEAGAKALITWDDIASIFSTSPNLVSCIFEGFTSENSSSHTPVVLKHLQHLYLDTSHYTHNDSLISKLNRNLTAPSLKTLTLANMCPVNWTQEPYSQFITRSSCSLEELHFVQLDLSSDDLVECLRLSPQLKTVHCQVSLEFSDRMAEWDAALNEFSICPNLEILSFRRDQVTVHADVIQADPVIHTIPMLTKRLCPPDGSSGTFRGIAVPEIYKPAMDCLHPLYEHPWRLTVLSNNYMFTRRSLWELYGGT